MPDPEHLRILKKGVKAFNYWREKNPFIFTNLVKANLSGADLRGADLSRVHLSEANLSEANLSGADLRGANLKKADLSRANLKQAHLRDARLSWANLRGVNLSRTDLSRANINGVNLSGADLSEADLRGAHLSSANLIGTDLGGANLRGAWLRRADLSWVHLSKAKLNMANLSEAQLSEAVLSEAYLKFADLRGAQLKGSNLSRAQLNKANLRGVDLRGAQLTGADLRRTDLSGVDLRGADLSDADFRQAIFENTIISSRTVLTLIRFALKDEQEAAIIFSDEREIAKNKNSSKKLKNYQYLTIEFQDEVSWKNESLAFLLLSIQTTYNNCFYLSSTEDKDIKIIEKMLERKCQVSAQDDIELKLLQQHSQLIIQYAQYSADNEPQVATVLSTLAELICAITKSYKTDTEGKRFASDLRKNNYIAEVMKNLEKDLEQIAIPTSNKVVLRNTGKLLFLASKSLQTVLSAIKETANIGEILVKMRKVDR
jgi:uncharacterized protein YjbI with pentapeptide repeats